MNIVKEPTLLWGQWECLGYEQALGGARGWAAQLHIFKRGRGSSQFPRFFSPGDRGEVSLLKRSIWWNARPARLAVRPHLFHYGRRDEGGSVGTWSKSSLSEELIGSLQAQYGGAQRRRRRVDLGDYQGVTSPWGALLFKQFLGDWLLVRAFHFHFSFDA